MMVTRAQSLVNRVDHMLGAYLLEDRKCVRLGIRNVEKKVALNLSTSIIQDYSNSIVSFLKLCNKNERTKDEDFQLDQLIRNFERNPRFIQDPTQNTFIKMMKRSSTMKIKGNTNGAMEARVIAKSYHQKSEFFSILFR